MPQRIPLFLLVIGALTAAADARSQAATLTSDWSLPSSTAIQEMLSERMQENGVGIVVGVVDKDGARVITFGRSGADDTRPLDGDTVFQVGSLTKIFTTLLLAQMVERNELSLDTPAQRLLPKNVVLPQNGQPISLRHLATHTSGLPSMPTNFDIRGKPEPYAAYTVDQLYEFLSGHTIQYEPGTTNSYSNLGVALLGRLLANRASIDSAEEIDYELLLQQRILQPLGMHDTSIHLNDDQQRRLAPGHDIYLHAVETWEMEVMPASGSLRSTANDMLTLIAAYLGLVETPLAPAMSRQLSDGLELNGTKHVLGWFSAGNKVFRHSGGKEGYRSGIVIDVKNKLGAIVLANARTADLPGNIAFHLVTGEALHPAPAAPPAKPRIKIAPETLRSYEGIYQFSNGNTFEVVRSRNGLVIRYPGGSLLQFAPTAPHEFFYVLGNDDITFEVDEKGTVEGLILYGDGKTLGNGISATRQ